MDRFLIAPMAENSGLQTNLKPWLIPDEAFSQLNNAYVFRGRVRKRFGSRWIGNNPLASRLKINIGTITSGTFSGNVATILVDAGMPTNIGQSFSIGTIIFTVYNSTTGPQQMLRTDNSSATATYDLATSNFVINGVALPDATVVYFYPSFPVMGLLTYEQVSINDEYVIAFDTRYAYTYIMGGWNRIAAGASIWTGSNSQFFWGDTWLGADASAKIFFVTNFNENETNFMRYYDGTQWNVFNPQIDATPNFLNSCRIIVPFKNRLLVFNTWEGPANSLPGTNYSNRCRYSQVGSPLASTAWRQDIPGLGNAIDASTTEAIITVEFIKDRLIVFFERSTWEVVYQGNQAYPFTWQQINTELGAESTFSIVPFDKVAIGIGNVGIHACNGSNVERIDEKIPDSVFEIHNNGQGVERVYGIRDYYVEMVYWSFPDTEADANIPYPNRVLIFNYVTGTWALNNDTITCFGYFQPIVGVTWDSNTVTWDDTVTWDSGAVQARFRQVVAGNQQGYTFICDADEPTNAPVLQITNAVSSAGSTTLTVTEHNLNYGEYIFIQGATWSDASNGLNNQIFQVLNVIDINTFVIVVPAITPVTGTYIGGGLIARVSQIAITTKEYNFYAKDGRNAAISKIDFMVDTTASGQIQVNFFTSTSVVPLLQESQANGVLLGTGNLDTYAYPDIPFESDTTRIWHPVYFQANGEVVQFQLILNDTQMRNVAIMECDFALHAMCIYSTPTSYRFQ